MRSRSQRASAGLVPPVEVAIAIFPRFTSEGRMKSQFVTSSAAFTQMPAARASAATARFTSPSSVAIITTSKPSRSPLRYSRSISLARPLSTYSRTAGIGSGATTVTAASASTSLPTFSCATLPPPMRITRRLCISTKIG